jgi:hypothetical protein
MRWVVVLACIGCYAPEPRPGAPCTNGTCPQGLACSPATDTCEREAIAKPDGAVADAKPDDAAADAPDAAATAALVHQQTSYAASAATLSVTLPTTPVNGNLLVMIGGTPAGSLDMVSGGATWTRATSSLINSNIEIWYGVADGSSATVTIRRANNAEPMWISASEWSGLAPSAILQGATADDGVTSSVSAGVLAVASPPSLLVFATSAYAPNVWGTPAPGAWTALTPIDGAAVTQRQWFAVATSAGSFSPAASLSSGAWDAALVAFRVEP